LKSNSTDLVIRALKNDELNTITATMTDYCKNIQKNNDRGAKGWGLDHPTSYEDFLKILS